ncbi:MAG: AAA family ATPase [Planctomycetes bacterium]|nr:AAA family ATPase [Planctomycetota bacterium]MCH9726426.1 AAA family ATPase [Planctomycetota bacterium]MCH9778235.1 AAA family ATPase [Planctomycetota bacterium]MCH9790743.1 AAA family ATPase [Planctomycetota bacterium]
MYETNFGFKSRPFTVSPCPTCFFQATEHQNVLDELLITNSSMNGISILTGDAGTGKTAICQQLISQLKSQFQIQFVEHCNFPTVRALLQTLLYGLTDSYEKVSEQELRLALTAEIRSLFLAHDQPLLVIVDEAHLLSSPFLEELRVLSDISFDGKPALQLMLSGQTNLEETLVQPALSSLNQRIGCQVYLDRMTRKESEAYIEYRVQRVASEERAYFSDDAIKLITHVSDGLPRCLNQICDHSLMLAYLQELPLVDESIAREAFSDLQQLPLHWNEPLQASTPLEQLQKDDDTGPSDLVVSDDISNEYEIDTFMEDRLNELAESSSNEVDSSSDDFDWDSSDLLSLGDETEAIEIGSDSETVDFIEAEQYEPESVLEIVPATHVVQENTPDAATIQDEIQSSVAEDGFVEIVDRYAAIDAGIDPATLPEATQGNPGISSGIPKLQPPQFHSLARSLPEENELSKQQSSDPEQIDVFPLLINSDLETEFPEVSNSETINLIEDQPEHSDKNVFQALAEEISEGEDTLEELLAAQVYEVCAETRKGLLNALNEISNYSESSETDANTTDSCVYDLVQPESEEAYDLELPPLMWEHSDTTEKANEPSTASYRLDSQSESEEQQSATSHLKGPALGRYKNLFTRLRRKQGLS